MKNIVYISILLTLSIVATAQNIPQGQLYAGLEDGIIDIDVNKPLNGLWLEVDDFVSATHSEKFASYKNLAIYLTDQFSSEQSKARSLYTWIALNISYDHNSPRDASLSKKQIAQNVWESRIAVCEGFSNLFHEMCEEAGLESRIIKGYVKDFAEMDLHFPNHAWNSVKIDGKWKLLDATWASVNNEGSLLTNKKDNQVRHKLNHFFLVSPTRMIYTHMPEDPYWQLSSNYVSMETFLKGKDQIKSVLSDPKTEERDFEQLISNYDKLDSLDKAIAYMERMECPQRNRTREYGLGIAYYYKAQKVLKEAKKQNRYQAIEKAKIYYQKSLEQLANMQEEDYGYEFSKDLVNSVEVRIASLQ